MIYRKAIGISHRYEPQSGWGTAIRYFEIADDEYALRHVEIFENGIALRYDRINWIDEVDSLALHVMIPLGGGKHGGPTTRRTQKNSKPHGFLLPKHRINRSHIWTSGLGQYLRRIARQ